MLSIISWLAVGLVSHSTKRHAWSECAAPVARQLKWPPPTSMTLRGFSSGAQPIPTRTEGALFCSVPVETPLLIFIDSTPCGIPAFAELKVGYFWRYAFT